MAIKVTGVTVIDDNLDADVQNLTATSVQLTGGVDTQGTLTWDVDEETLSLVQDGVNLPLGQALEVHCRNNTGTEIPAGSVVMATGTIGSSGRITVAPYVADGNTDVRFMLGVTAETIAADADGKVLSFGKIKNVDTSAYTEGDILYVSTTVAGGLTATEPASPNMSVPVAIVVNAASNGTLFVRVHPEDENEVTTAVNNAVAALVAGAPAALDTLNELAAAINDNESFSVTMTNALAGKVDKIDITGGTVGSASQVPVITYNTQGQITSATTTSVAGVSSVSYDDTINTLTISTADGGSFDANISAIGGSIQGTLADTKVQYGTNYSGTPQQGSFFFDSLNQKLKVYTGSEFIDAVPAGTGSTGGGETTDAVATLKKYTYSIVSTTNALSGADNNNNALAYVVDGSQNVEVYVNGIKQVEGALNDYVATTGTSVTLTYNLAAGDIVDILVYELLTQDAFYLKSETYTKTEVNTQLSTALGDYVPLIGNSTIQGNVTLSNGANATTALTNADDLVIKNSGAAGISIHSADTNSQNIYFGSPSNESNARIEAYYGTGNEYLQFHVGSSNAVKLKVTENGEVSVNATTVPTGSTKLHVEGSLNLKDGFNLTWGGDYTNNYATIFASSATNYIEVAPAGAGSTTRYRFNDTGLGVGTVNPSYRLQVEGDTYVNGRVISTGLNSVAQPVYKSQDGAKVYTHLAARDVYQETGALLLRTSIPGHNASGNGNMFQIRITGYSYAGQGPIDLLIGAYSGENNYYSSYVYGTYNESWANNIFIGTDSNGKVVIQLGDTSLTQQCQIAAVEFIHGFINTSADYSKDWYFETVTTLPTMTQVVSPTRKGSEVGSKVIRYGSLTVPEGGFKVGTSSTVYSTGELNSINASGVGLGVKTGSYCLGLWTTTATGNLINFAGTSTGNSVGSISHNGTGITFNTTSDRRLKENIELITDAKEKLLAMKPCTFSFKADEEQNIVTGFIAQEMQEVVPEAVTGDPNSDEMMSMDYGRITPILVAALQDAHNKIQELEARLITLEEK